MDQRRGVPKEFVDIFGWMHQVYYIDFILMLKSNYSEICFSDNLYYTMTCIMWSLIQFPSMSY
jgi:hypothetical protein